jgi:cation:H+ antiporter
MDISQGLAIAFLALVAVLPEYAVDLYFAWSAAAHPEYAGYATANMTGANRLLIGIAWPLIVVLNRFRTGRSEVVLPADRGVELGFLIAATAYSFVLPLKGSIGLFDAVVFVSLFVGYMWKTAHSESREPELVGPALAIAQLSVGARRAVVIGLFIFAATVILACAEPFAEALIHLGRSTGIDEFILVQWLAPLASEAPEVVIACILTLKGDAQAGMGAMVSSKVNQWTLLVGTLSVVYSLALGHPGALPLGPRQVEEVLLTSAQSFFAVVVLSDLRLSMREAGMLFALFVTQLFVPDPTLRYAFVVIYMTLGTAMLMRRRNELLSVLRGAFVRTKP